MQSDFTRAIEMAAKRIREVADELQPFTNATLPVEELWNSLWGKLCGIANDLDALTPPAQPALAEAWPDEPTEEMIAAAVATFGGIVGTPENLAKPEYIERMTARQRSAVIAHYKAMRAAAPVAGREE